MTRKRLLIANWKLNKTRAEAKSFCDAFTKELKNLATEILPEIGICPSFTLLNSVQGATSGSTIMLGAQNMATEESGALTGEVSVLQLKELDTKLVILGHSERRQFFGETNAMINKKIKLALKHELLPVICVGESLEQRDNEQTDIVIKEQVDEAIAGLSPLDKKNLIFAYEPVWAIGTGKVCETAEAGRVCGRIREWGGTEITRVLYGGSMKPSNAAELMSHQDIDGGLIGGASLESASFIELITETLVANPVGSL